MLEAEDIITLSNDGTSVDGSDEKQPGTDVPGGEW